MSLNFNLAKPCVPGSYSNYSAIWVSHPGDWDPVSQYDPGAITNSECLACPVGALCGPGNQITDPIPCTAGSACLGSQVEAGTSAFQPEITTLCPAGYMCPTGTGSKFSIPCPLGTYQLGVGK